MPANFSIKFIVNEKTQTRVLRLTHTVTDFVLTKGNFSVTFPDGSTRIKTDFTSPDITSPGAFIDIAAVLDTNNNIITGNYKIDFVAIDNASAEKSAQISFDFNWAKPTNSILNLSDVLIPEVKFKDNASYSPIGSFTGTLNRTLSASFPSTSEAAGNPAVSTVSSNTIDIVSSGKYYDGTYNPSSDVTVNYTHSSDSRITIQYIELFTKTFLIKKCPTQLELVQKINNYRELIDGYKDKNDTQFNLLSEQYDLVIALYTHIITRYETSTQDGSEPILRELLSILEPYSTSYTPQLTRMLPFELASTGSNSFSISDGTNTDQIPLGSTLTFSSGNPALTIGVSNNLVTYTPTFGTAINTFAQGNDSRFHNAVTIGTSNGLSLASQVLSLAAATSSSSGAMSAADKSKLDGIAAGANTGTVTSIGISVPSAFTVSNSPVTTSGTINISATGNPLQYITGAGALATLNTGAVPESGNLYFTNARSRSAISVSGSLSYNSTTGVISYTTPNETDPVFLASAAYGITSTNISNWNTAYGWGNHASAGYLTSINSSQVTTALGYTPENAANKGIANGYASLDGAGLVPSTQLPSYVDDVLEYADLASLPVTGTTGKIYVTLDTNKIYRWSGTVYVEISSSAGGGGTWGSIIGTLSNQTDLQAALDAKQDDLNGTGFVKASGTTITYDNSTYLTTSAAATTYVPYTGAISSVNLGANSLSADYLKISTTSTRIVDVSEVVWNSIDGTFDMGLIGGVTLQAGQEMHFFGKASGVISNGDAVMFAGSEGDHILISKASPVAINANPEYFIGIATQDFADNQFGYVTVFGKVRGLDTTAYTLPAILWFDSTNVLSGKLTTIKPSAPNAKILVAAVVRVHATQGILMVRPHTMPMIQDIQDVSITDIANNDLLVWNTNKFENKSIAETLGYTPYNAANPSNYIALTALSSTATGLTYTNTTGVFSLTSGYVIPTTTEQSNWNTAYAWGNHASAGYLTTSVAATTYQPLDGDLTAIAGLAGTSGFLKKTAANTWSLDTNTYLTSFTETDPIYTASSWYSTTNNSMNWDAAYAWGNHASAGYLTSITSSNVTTALGYTPVTNARTLTINGTTYDLSADRSWTISAGISGTLTTNYIPKATGASALGNSIIYDGGTQIGIGTANPNTVLGLVYNNGLSGAVMDIQNTNSTGASAIDIYTNTGSYMGQIGGAASHGSLMIDSWLGGISLRTSSTERVKLATTGQLRLNAYTSTSAFTGTAAGYLAFDSSGNILSVAAPSGGTVLNGTGFVKASGTTITYDNSTYLPTSGGTLTGDLTISKATPYLTLTNTSTGTSSQIYQSGNDMFIKNSTSGWLYLGNNKTVINGSLDVSGNAVVSLDVYARDMYIGGWFRNNVSGQGLYNQATTNHFYSTSSNDWNIGATGGYPRLWLRNAYAGTSLLSLYSEPGYAGMLNSSSYWMVRMNNNGSGYTGGLDLFGPVGLRGIDNNVAGGMKMITHSVNKVGSSKFLKIYAGTNNYFTGFIFGYNFDNYPPDSTTNTGAGFSYQFGGWSDGSGSHGDKFFDLTHFGGNNVGNLGREMNTDGNGYIITSPTSTGAGGYKVSATIMIFARDMSKLSFTYY